MFGLISIVPALVLLVACFNVANVLMARNVERRMEFAMRQAIGATRARLVRQLLVESLMIALLAAASGFLVSFGLTALIGLRPTDGMTFAGAAAILCLVAVAASYIPARRAARIDPLRTLRHD